MRKKRKGEASGIGIVLKVAKKICASASRLAGWTGRKIIKAVSKPEYKEIREVKRKKGDIQEFRENLETPSGYVCIILGRRGSGKTALALRIGENSASGGFRVFLMGVPRIPGWAERADNPEDVPEGSVLIIDEAGLNASSFDSRTRRSRKLLELLVLCRHKRINLIFASQNSANIDINILRQANCLAVKKPSLLQKRFDRKEITGIIEEASREIEQCGEGKELAYILSDEYSGVVSAELPGKWSERMSRGYAKA